MPNMRLAEKASALGVLAPTPGPYMKRKKWKWGNYKNEGKVVVFNKYEFPPLPCKGKEKKVHKHQWNRPSKRDDVVAILPHVLSSIGNRSYPVVVAAKEISVPHLGLTMQGRDMPNSVCPPYSDMLASKLYITLAKNCSQKADAICQTSCFSCRKEVTILPPVKEQSQCVGI
jgi:hypothetical protein